MTAAALVVVAGAAHAQQTPATDKADNKAATTVNEVVVTGQRAALRNAINTKKNAEVILDSVSADDAGKYPDNSITEVLQRVAGVNITRIQTGGNSENYLGEGTGITIRGLDSVVSQLNGRDSFSSANGRTLAWEDIPPELAQGVDIYKSESADLPEGGFGGTINLRTRQPFDFKGFTVNATADYNYADYAQKGHPGGTLLVSDRWQTPYGEMGLLLNAAYSDLSTKADGVQVSPYFPQVYDPGFSSGNTTRLPYLGDPGASQVYVPAGINFNQRLDDRTRVGLYGAFQWRPTDTLSLFATAFQSQYTLDSVYHAMYVDSGAVTVLAPGSTNTFNSNGGLTSSNGFADFLYIAPPASGSGSGVGLGTAGGWAYQPIPYDFETSYSHQVNTTTDYSIGGDWKVANNLDIKFALQRVDSSATSTDHYGYDYAYLPSYGLTLSPKGSSTLPVLTLPANSVDLTNPANYGWLATMDHLLNNQGHETAAYADGLWTVSDGGLLRSVKFGVKLTNRTEDDDQTLYNYQQLTPPFGDGLVVVPGQNGGQPVYEALSDIPGGFKYLSTTNPAYSQLFNIGSLFNGKTGLPTAAYFPSLAMLNTNFATLHQQLGAPGDTTQPVGFTPADLSKLSENTETVYVMGNFRSDDNGIVPFRGNIGVRVVAFDDHATGSVITSAFTTPTSLLPVTNYYAPGAPGSIINNGQYQPNTVQYVGPSNAVKTSGGHSEVDALPSLNIQFLPTPEVHIRFAASINESRPTFAQLNPAGGVFGTYAGTYESYFNGSRGNPNLKPEKADQLDFSFEWYPKKGGLFHFDLFYKQIHDYISTEPVTVNYVLPTTVAGGIAGNVDGQGNGGCVAPVTLGESCPQTISAVMIQPFNEHAPATIKGLEVGIQKYADFLPSPFNGFGIDFNYTYIDSQQPGAIAYDMLGNKINGLPATGLSKNTINLAALFDKGPLSMRLAYNWRDDFLVSTAAYQTSGSYNYINNLPPVNGQTAGQQGQVITFALPVFQAPVGTIDGNLSYKLTSNVTWVLEASNLNKAVTQLYMGVGTQQYNRSWYTADRRYTTVIRVSF